MKLSVSCLKEKFEANLPQICKAYEVDPSLFSIIHDLTRKLRGLGRTKPFLQTDIDKFIEKTRNQDAM